MKTRNELIAEAKEMGLTFERPIAQMKSEVIEAAILAAAEKHEETIAEEVIEEMPIEAFIAAATGAIAPEVKEKKVTIADEIIALANSGMSRVQIHAQLQAKHPKINYRYVVQILLKAKAAGIEINVPRQERVFAPKADAIDKLEAKLAKMKAAAAELEAVIEEA
jgi:excinuclease UvrABC ATPase subunit